MQSHSARSEVLSTTIGTLSSLQCSIIHFEARERVCFFFMKNEFWSQVFSQKAKINVHVI